MNYKKLSNFRVFVVNSITTYFFAFLTLWSGHTTLIYWTWFVFVVTSNILFTIYPKKFSPIVNFIVKIILHAVTTFLLMLIFGWLFIEA
jgi:hypothetical protein